MTPDLVVIGAGAAGIGAARTARSRGASVLLIERARIGGDCTWTGCVPSKSVIEAAASGEAFAGAMGRAHAAIASIAATESADALRSEGIDVVEGEARFTGPGHLDIDGRAVVGKRVVIATGARPAVPPIPGIETVPYLTNETLFDVTDLPSTLTVLGGGPIGVEMAQAFARLGSAVTVIEALDRLLPKEEALASVTLTEVFTASGITVKTGSAVSRVESRVPGGGLRIHLSDGSYVDTGALLVAVGRTPSTAGLGLESAGIRVDNRGFIRTDDRLRTNVRGVFAVGDVAEHLQFTHVAYETGRIAALNALARLPIHHFRQRAVPWVTFTDPEVARVGLTEAETVSHGGRVAFLPMTELDRAITAGRTEGFIKLIAGPRRFSRGTAGGRILGATIVAPRAGEMIHEVVLAMRSGMFPARIALATHAYPTWSMAVQQAAAQFFGGFGGRKARPATAKEPIMTTDVAGVPPRDQRIGWKGCPRQGVS